MALARKALLLNRFGGTLTFCRSKHYNPKFKWLRKMKYIDMGLIDFHKKPTEEELREHLKEKGVLLTRPATEIPVYVDSSYEIFDPYVPQPGDGLFTSVTARVTSVLSLKEAGVKKSKNLMAIRKVRNYIANFDENHFAQTALRIYINAHTALASNDLDEMEKYVTVNAFVLMSESRKNKTVKWKYIESLDPPKTVQVRTGSVGTEENVFAQMTVRIHSKQMLAIYDRFGRLMYGSEILAKDVLEFVVFEIQLSDPNGSYKLHHKIIPDWAEPKFTMERTFHEPKEEEEEEEEDGGSFMEDRFKLIRDNEKNVENAENR